jgi:hypothetical protein
VLLQRRASIIRVLEPVEFVSHIHQNFLFAFVPTAEEAADACLLVCFCTMLGSDEGYAGEGDHREVVARVLRSEDGGDRRQIGPAVRSTMRVDVGERRMVVVAGTRNPKVDAVYILRLDNPAKNKEYNASYITCRPFFPCHSFKYTCFPIVQVFATPSMIPACPPPRIHPSPVFPSKEGRKHETDPGQTDMDMDMQSTKDAVIGFRTVAISVLCRTLYKGREGGHVDRQICRVLYTWTSLVREQNTPARQTKSCIVRKESSQVLHCGYPVHLCIPSILSIYPPIHPSIHRPVPI